MRALREMRLELDKAIQSGEIANLSEAEIDQEARTLVAVMNAASSSAWPRSGAVGLLIALRRLGGFGFG